MSAIALSLAAGLAVLFSILLNFGTPGQQENAALGLGWAGLVACVGVGFFVASRFCSRAVRRDRDDDQAR